jgi:hypothetical protein
MSNAPYGDLPPTEDALGKPQGQTYYGEQGANSGNGNSNGSSTGDGAAATAKDQAGQVGQTAKDSGQRVAGTAVEQGKNVIEEGRHHARNLTHEVGQQVHEQTSAQKDKATSGLRSLGDELQSMATNGGQSGVASDLAQQAGAKAHDLATWLEQRDPGSILDEVRGLARRKPGTFLLGAVAAGVVAGRLTRGAVAAAKDEGSSDVTSAPRTTSGTAQPASTDDATLTGGSEASIGLPYEPAMTGLTEHSEATGGYR